MVSNSALFKSKSVSSKYVSIASAISLAFISPAALIRRYVARSLGKSIKRSISANELRLATKSSLSEANSVSSNRSRVSGCWLN